MSILRPFCALRPNQEKASQVAAVPYDVVNKQEAKALAHGNPLSFLHISRSEIDLGDGIDSYSDQVYQKAASNLNELIQKAPLSVDEKPSLYLYHLKMGVQEQIGIVGCFSVDEYDSNQIKKHEKTRREKEDDRTRHILEVSAQTGPVFLTYRHVDEITSQVERIQKEHSPQYQFTAVDGVVHSVWSVPNPEKFVKLFSDRVSALYIADGHHRAASASRARAELARLNKNHQGNEEYNFFLAVAFPDNQLRILPYHRVVKDLNGMSEAKFLERVMESFKVQSGDSSLPVGGEFGMYLRGQWHRLVPRVGGAREAENQKALDVTVLQDLLLQPILGIGDLRTDKRIDFVGGIRGTSELEKLVNQGEAAVAFSLHPTQLKDVMDVSDQGGIMPPKSTWFEPKLRDGLFCHFLK